MRRLGPGLAIACVLIVGAITLLGVARNRAGEPDSDVVLTERELSIPRWLPEENTGLSLRIEWFGPRMRSAPDETRLDRAKLESLGFDCGFPAEAPSAEEHYGRVVPRDAVLVLEYDGDAARRWLAEREKETATALEKAAGESDAAKREKRESEARDSLERARSAGTRLFLVDVGLDALELRRRYPDRSRYVLARGTVRMLVEPAAAGPPAKPARVYGVVGSLLVDAIHVPPGQRALLDSLVASDRRAAPPKTPPGASRETGAEPWHPPRYRVRVRWGHRLEPWIVSVEPI